MTVRECMKRGIPFLQAQVACYPIDDTFVYIEDVNFPQYCAVLDLAFNTLDLFVDDWIEEGSYQGSVPQYQCTCPNSNFTFNAIGCKCGGR